MPAPSVRPAPLQVLFDKARDLFLRRKADERLFELAVLEHHERGNAAHLETARWNVRVLVDVHLADRRAPLVIGGELLHDRCDTSARAAPFGPEVHEGDD